MLDSKELLEVRGGALSGTVIEALTNLMDKIFDLGRSWGSSLRRLISGDRC